jgi:outer membrane receptor for ferrienterochelin and colicins
MRSIPDSILLWWFWNVKQSIDLWHTSTGKSYHRTILKMKFFALLIALITVGVFPAFAQHTVRFKIVDAESTTVLQGVNVLIVGTTTGAVSNVEGLAELRNLGAGQLRFRISLVGYESIDLLLKLPEQVGDIILVELEHQHEELEDITVYAARSTRLIERVPTRAEVIAGEELEEKANMNSSNISMILRETPGVQVQQSDPSSANMSFRIQGLNGRYTQLLQDGLPMYGGISSSLSIVQIPPLNLKQVEIIKGSSSTLYGGGAIAGLVNLVTKTYEDAGTTVMLNALSTVGGDANLFSAGKIGSIGYTLYLSGVSQKAYDVNNDGFSEVPQTGRIHAEPMVWLQLGSVATLRTGIGYTSDKRKGGFQNKNGTSGVINSDYYTSTIETDRFKALADLEIKTKTNGSIQFRNVLSTTSTKSTDNLDYRQLNDQTQFYAEANTSLSGTNSDLTAGLSYLYNKTSGAYRDRQIIAGVTDGTVGIFGQHTFEPIEQISIESGLRIEAISGVKPIILPRLNLLTNWGTRLTSRVGFGTGYKHIHSMFGEVNDWIQQSNHRAIYNLRLLDDNAIERSVGFTADLDFRTIIGQQLGISVNQLFFHTRINDPFLLKVNNSRNTQPNDQYLGPMAFLEVANRDGYTRTMGMETNLKWSYRNFKWYQFYTYTDVSEVDLGSDRPVLLTPKHRLGSVIMLEEHDSYRIGFETYITGSQELSLGAKTDPYVILGLMAEKTWNKLSIFINFENFTDTRMKDSNPLWSGSVTYPERNTELYAPVDGRVVNGGIKLRF